ncbi:MAG TPA: hypothetical protein VHE30_18510 [Polyangiaceae bacterium]|nr:hypothetical protein [Polyangiaceae bacterium]
MKFRTLLLLSLSLCPAVASAQQVDDRARSAARALAEEGVTALQGGDVPNAVDKLERAYEIVHLPTVGLWSARALAKAGRLVNAAERYNEVSRWSGSPDPRQDQAKADAAKEREELLPRIPSVVLSIEGAKPNEVAVTLDGEPVLAALIGTAQPVDPKHHVARATRGADAVEQPFDVAEGQKLPVTLKFGAPGAAAPQPAPAPAVAPAPAPAQGAAGVDVTADHPSSWSTQRTIGLAVGGVGVVSAVVSGVFTASALSHKSDAKPYCNGGACTDQKGVDALSDARSAGNVATITGIAGIALIGAGAVLFFTAPSGEKIAILPSYRPNGGGVVATGSF